MSILLRLVLPVLVMGLAACRPADGISVPLLQVNANQESIIGGASMLPSDGLSHSEVYILDTTSVSKSNCTGVVVSRTVILTAAHCVLNSIKTPSNFQVVFYELASDTTDKSSPQMATGQKFTVDKVVSDHLFDPNQLLSGHDLAFMHLSSPIAESVPASFSDHSFNLSTLTIEVSGFGRTVDMDQPKNPNTPLSLRQATVTESTQFEGSTWSDDTVAPLWLFDQKSQGMCRGDSGGPVAVQVGGQDYVIGIASFVFNIQNRNKPCSGQSAYTNLLRYRQWLKLSFERISPGDQNPFN